MIRQGRDVRHRFGSRPAVRTVTARPAISLPSAYTKNKGLLWALPPTLHFSVNLPDGNWNAAVCSFQHWNDGVLPAPPARGHWAGGRRVSLRRLFLHHSPCGPGCVLSGRFITVLLFYWKNNFTRGCYEHSLQHIHFRVNMPDCNWNAAVCSSQHWSDGVLPAPPARGHWAGGRRVPLHRLFLHHSPWGPGCVLSGRFITVLLFYWKNNTHKPPVISPHEITRPAMGAVCIYLLRSFLHHLPTFLKLSTSHRGPNCMARLSLRPRNPGQRKTVKNKGSCLSQVPAHWSQLLCDKNPLKQNLFENGLHLETFNKIVSF